MNTDCEYIIVGAGVVGLAIAATLASNGKDVLVLEKAASIGTMTSARNSEVIHAGIYYPRDSLKARLCVSGRQALYRYCQDRYINHRQCGKLIVATSASQVTQLKSIQTRALANGVNDIRLLSANDAMAMESELHCKAALYSPSTGIVDSHGLMVSLLGDAQSHGAALATHAPVISIEHNRVIGGFTVHVGGQDPIALTSQWVINAAGHGACALIATSELMHNTHCVEPILVKGNYFCLSGKAPFSRLVYPVPEPGGLGVHFTIDLGAQGRFGPDVEPIETENYAVNPLRAGSFYSAVRHYWPGLPDNALSPDYAGIRPKIRLNGDVYNDFMIQTQAQHGVPGLVNLFGIESPGLTASLAIAQQVGKL